MIAMAILLAVVPAAGTGIWAYRRVCRWVDAAAVLPPERYECMSSCSG
jgi:hypothetical protein